jgi:hypothetical protein
MTWEWWVSALIGVTLVVLARWWYTRPCDPLRGLGAVEAHREVRHEDHWQEG